MKKNIRNFIVLIAILLFSSVQNLSYSQTILSDKDTICVGDVITFTITGTTGLCHSLYFSDDGSSSNSAIVSHQYYFPDLYHYASLTDFDSSDCTSPKAYAFKSIVVYDTLGIIDPLPTEICPNTPIYFSTSSIGRSYKWDFGDGSSSSKEDVEHAFKTLGTKTIQFILYNTCGNDTVTTSINVVDTIKPDFNQGPPTVDFNDMLICPGAGAQFYFYDIPGHTVRWYFGDGDSSTATNPIHAFKSQGIYSPLMVLTNGCMKKDTAYTDIVKVNLSDTVALYSSDYSVSPQVVCPNTTVKYDLFTSYPDCSIKWDFGDGNTSTSANATHQYANYGNYTATLTITNLCGDTATGNALVEVKTGPAPYINSWQYGVNGFGYDSVKACPNTPVNFYYDYLSYLDYSHKWYFGDGDSSSEANPIHTYSTIASYSPSLLISDGCGQFTNYSLHAQIGGTDTSDVYIYVSPADTICLFDSVYFDSYVYGPVALSYNWNFGDGGTSTLPYPAYSYSSNATYNVSLEITNGCGVKNTAISQIVINSSGKPVAEFTASAQHKICQFDNIQFTAKHTNPGTTYFWDFGDGNTSTDKSPQHFYSNSGSIDGKKIYLVVENACSKTDTLMLAEINDDMPLEVLALPSVDAGSDKQIPLGGSIILGGNPTAGGTQPMYGRKYSWSPTAGLDSDSIANPIASPSITTTYYVTVTDINDNGGIYPNCSFGDSITITVTADLSGRIFSNGLNDTIKGGYVYLIDYDTTNHVSMAHMDTTVINADGTYQFNKVPLDKYFLLADPSIILHPGAVPTYYGDTVFWTEAQIFNHISNSANVDIIAKVCPPTSGPGRIEGIVKEGNNYGKWMGAGDPVRGIDVELVKKPSGAIAQHTTSDTTTANAGSFTFNNIPIGNYGLHVEITGVPVDVSMLAATFSVTASDTVFSMDVFIDSNLVYINTGTGVTAQLSGELTVHKTFPNPASNYIDLELENYSTVNNNIIQFNFYDIMGKEVLSLTPVVVGKGKSFIRLNTNSLDNGIYLLGIGDSSKEGEVTILSKIVILK